MANDFFSENLYIWVKWALNLAVFAAAFCVPCTHARQGSNSESLPVSQSQNGSTFGPGTPFWTFMRSLSPSLSVDFTVQQRPYGPHTCIKATTRFRGKMASPSSPSLISSRGTFDPISNLPLWQSCALVTRRQDKTASKVVQGLGQPTRPTPSVSGPLSTKTVPSWRSHKSEDVGPRMSTLTCIALTL